MKTPTSSVVYPTISIVTRVDNLAFRNTVEQLLHRLWSLHSIVDVVSVVVVINVAEILFDYLLFGHYSAAVGNKYFSVYSVLLVG